MIITRTPLRISFGGGGTDLSAFYRIEPGAVTSTAIDKYVYIIVKKRFDNSIRVSYSKTEIASRLDEIQHPIVRHAMERTGVTSGVEIISIADVPAGTGLGSSSAFTVGLLNALHAFRGSLLPAEQLARQAAHVEIDLVKEPIGKQDQYIAAYGGLRHITFDPSENVRVEYVLSHNNVKKQLEDNLIMFYTGLERKAGPILMELRNNAKSKYEVLKSIRDIAIEMKKALLKPDLYRFGKLLHEGWILKMQTANSISNEQINEWYKTGLFNGALGGKLLGAGGGGFLLFYAEKSCHKRIEKAMPLRRIVFSFEPDGTQLIYVGGEDRFETGELQG